MNDYVRPPYLEELPPTRRLPDYVPVPLAAPPAVPATVHEPESLAATGAAAAPESTTTATLAADKQTVKRIGHISSPVHRVQRPTGLAISFTLTVTEDEDR